MRFLAEKLKGQKRVIDQIVAVTEDLQTDLSNYSKLFGHRFIAENEGSAVSMTKRGIQFRLVAPARTETVYEVFLKERGKGIFGFRERISSDQSGIWKSHIQEKGLTAFRDQETLWIDYRKPLGCFIGLFESEEPLIGYEESPDLDQICLVSKDAQKLAENMMEYAGVGPWEFGHTNNHTAGWLESARWPRDQFPDADFLTGIAMYGNLEFELVQPCLGPLPYFHFIEKCGMGIQHIKQTIPKEKWQAKLQQMRDNGIASALDGNFGGTSFSNLDTYDLFGYVYELSDDRPVAELPAGYDPYIWPKI